MEKKTVSSHQIIDLIYLAGFTFFVFKILFTGEVSAYVHPRFIPFLWAAAGLAVLIVIATLLSPSAEHCRTVSWKRPVILIIPLICGLTVPPSSDVTVNVSDAPRQKKITVKDRDFDALPEPVLHARAAGVIHLDQDHFFMVLQDMYDNPALYCGKKITVTGMAYHGKKSSADEFAVMRLMMTCCTADLQPVGLVCTHQSASTLHDKTWVRIEGELSSKSFEQGTLPFIIVKSIAPAEKPAQEYIYPI